MRHDFGDLYRGLALLPQAEYPMTVEALGDNPIAEFVVRFALGAACDQDSAVARSGLMASSRLACSLATLAS